MRSPIVWFVVACAVLVLLSEVQSIDSWPTCVVEATRIHDVQGSGDGSPLVGETVTTTGVVTRAFSDAMGGLFLQELDGLADTNPATSEALFIRGAGLEGLDVGDLICVTGTVSERSGRTTLSATALSWIRGEEDVSATVVRLPLDTIGGWESLEGMLVRFDEPLVVTDTYGLWRYGQLVLADDRLTVPTNHVAPGEAARVLAEDNARRRIVLDDGSMAENPSPVPYPVEGMTTAYAVRTGDRVFNVQGVVDQAGEAYRIQPTQAPQFALQDQVDVPECGGRLRIVAFNVENYFNGDGDGGGFPTTRGAATYTEFERQRAKLLSALAALEADVFALAEIENDGYGPKSAVSSLTKALNERVGGAYAYVVPDCEVLGGDEIAVAILYDTTALQRVGDALSPESFSPMNRFPLAQTFEETSTGERLTVVVNHFKSRSSSRASGANRDQGDGQGCWNANRTQAADELIRWIDAIGIRSVDADVLLVGDLNAYAMEDPLMRLQSAGFVDLVRGLVEREAYTYVYAGEAGTLDHALASEALAGQVADVAIWHINADAPSILGYETRYKTDEMIRDLYLPNAARSSDHDPVIIGIDLGEATGDQGL